jgi:hypothetical protein
MGATNDLSFGRSTLVLVDEKHRTRVPPTDLHALLGVGSRSPLRLCPLCRQPGRRLEVSSSNPFAQVVDYYRCDPCGHVWWHNKGDPNSPAVNVTKPGGKSPQPEQ